jgi:predicted TIM-barrel enzyme
VFTPDDAIAMTRAGADILVAHMGLTTKGMIGAKTTRTLDACVAEIQAIHDAARAERADVLVICHGGPISEPDDARFILERTKGVVGFYGASSMERLPTEEAITARVAQFRDLRLT